MGVKIVDGWLVGFLADDKGREYEIKRFPQGDTGPLAVARPNLVLHTTETDGYIEQLRFPSQFQCGEGIIGQHIPLGRAGDAVRDWDRFNYGIELVGRSQIGVWLPGEGTTGPAVALTAWLHETKRIKTGLARPRDWPLHVDRLPAAVESYYRRQAGIWPQEPGVYGHIEIPGNTHWDPGGFNYPRFFKRVQAVLDGGEEDVRIDDYIEGGDDFIAAFRAQGGDPGPAPADRSSSYRAGWRVARFAAANPRTSAHNHDELSPKTHSHDVTGEAR